ncbi:MAG TPA: S41 family peptidase [Vicinamibacteria bacterium]|nr:S41 family peptidase [Vicinamibacteria bacterium]
MRFVPAAVLSLLAGAALAGAADGPSNFDRGRARTILKTVKSELQKHYYDPAFHGVDLEARFKEAEEKVASAGSVGQLMGIVARAVMDLEDSHTRFLPPSYTADVDYGWSIQMVGERCLVSDVAKGSDAEAQGLKVGDVVLEAEGVQPTRENLWKFFYLYETLRPQAAMTAVVQSPGQAPRKVQFKASVKQGKRVLDLTEDSEDIWTLVRQAENAEVKHYVQEVGDVVVWRMPAFYMERRLVDKVAGMARKKKALVIDMRGNPGGAVNSLQDVTAALFDRELKIGDARGRKETKPLSTKRHKEPFTGTVVAVVDSESASSSEVLARVLQIEKRGTVVGDRTAGAVMRARFHSYQLGVDRIVPYGLMITDSDLVMTDGKSLEKVGVSPDVALLPTPEDLAAGRDPVLARAIELAGGTLDAKGAGALFPRDDKD